MEVMDKFNKYIFKTYDIQVTDSLTISRLSLNIYLSHYLGESKIPLINKPDIYNFVKLGYYGGITEVYKPFCEKGNYYDVNSEYPYVSKGTLPGNECKYIEDFTGLGLDLDKLFGFFYCKIKTNNAYLGLLPLHINGSLILPNGEFYGVWFSEELKFAKENGYDITVLKGYNFNRIDNVFNKYVDELYEIRSKSFGVQKAVTKMLLNAPFGRFGMSIFKPITEFVNREKLDFILSTHEVKSLVEINQDNFLLTYNPEISKTVCVKSGLNYIKVLNINKKDIENNSKFKDVSITTSAAITSYARIYMNKVKVWILSNKGLGDLIGLFKLEYKIEKGYFISAKTYCIKTVEGVVIKKAKGVYSSSLNLKDYVDMYLNKQDVLAEKNYSIINYNKGSVNIDTKETILHHDAYTKREKVYNSNGKWIDTKPLVYKVDSNNNLYKV